MIHEGDKMAQWVKVLVALAGQHEFKSPEPMYKSNNPLTSNMTLSRFFETSDGSQFTLVPAPENQMSFLPSTGTSVYVGILTHRHIDKNKVWGLFCFCF